MDWRRIIEFAEKHKLILNPEPDRLRMLLRALLKMEEKYGVPFCPCRVLDYDVEDLIEGNRDKICPCQYALEDIEEKGHCLCTLFWDPLALGPRQVKALFSDQFDMMDLDVEYGNEEVILKLSIEGYGGISRMEWVLHYHPEEWRAMVIEQSRAVLYPIVMEVLGGMARADTRVPG